MNGWKCLVNIAWLLLGLSFAIVVMAAELDPVNEEGVHIYREGRLPNGEPIQASVQNDVIMQGQQAACVNCHRRSGLGTTEGNSTVLPLTAEYLFQPRAVGRQGQFRLRTIGTGTRPAYDDESLKRAIMEGVDPAGRPLDPMMPRYHLKIEALDALVAYLKSLKSSGSPGVSEDTIHFATVVSQDAPEVSRKAMLDVLEVYFHDKNAETRHETKRAAHAPWHRDWKYQAYRKWELVVWKLKGPPETWPGQLEAYYREKPVFAMVSGLVNGPWAPIHGFCEQQQLPCLFPNTDRPVFSDQDYYTFYFSQGLALEAKVLTKYLLRKKGLRQGDRIRQCYTEAGRDGAVAFRDALKQQGIEVSMECRLDSGGVDKSFWRKVTEGGSVQKLVLWWNDPSAEELRALSAGTDPDTEFYFSSSLIDEIASLGDRLQSDRAFAVHPFELPGQVSSSAMRNRTWLKRKKILNEKQFRIQANAFFAATAIGRVIMHLRDKFSREYFIELIEHETDNSLVTSVYPRLTLGPGQRYASRGAYILRLPSASGQMPVGETDWLVP